MYQILWPSSPHTLMNEWIYVSEKEESRTVLEKRNIYRQTKVSVEKVFSGLEPRCLRAIAVCLANSFVAVAITLCQVGKWLLRRRPAPKDG